MDLHNIILSIVFSQNSLGGKNEDNKQQEP